MEVRFIDFQHIIQCTYVHAVRSYTESLQTSLQDADAGNLLKLVMVLCESKKTCEAENAISK